MPVYLTHMGFIAWGVKLQLTKQSDNDMLKYRRLREYGNG